MVQRDVGVISLLANNHCMPLTKCSTANILATQADIKTLSKQEGEKIQIPMNNLVIIRHGDPEFLYISVS